MIIQRLISIFVILLVILMGFSGCPGCPYSFSGASVPPHLKTIAIPNAVDQSGSGDPMLREEVTTQLVQRFQRDNTLELADKGSADCLIECVITFAGDVPLVVKGGEQVAQRRVSVTVHTTFQDLKLRKKLWERDFSNTGDYESGGSASKRNDGFKEAVRKITEDILIETVSGW